MDFMDKIKENLDSIKAISGVENVVLTQRDGNPLLSSGVWLSKNEIFSVSAATSAIYNVGLSLHGEYLRYMVIEGPKAKIMIAPLGTGRNGYGREPSLGPNLSEYFIAITTLSQVNLGSIFIKTQKSLKNIFEIITASNISFKPPLREFNEKQVDLLLNNFNSKKDQKDDYSIVSPSFSLTPDIFKKCDDILWNFNKAIPNLIYSSISFNGGFVVTSIQPSSNFNLSTDSEIAMSFSIFDTASRYAWLLKKTNINSIFLDCNHYLQFIMGFDSGIFSSYIFKNSQRIGFIRLIIPKYLELIQGLLKQAMEFSIKLDTEPQNVFSPLIIR